MDKVWKVYWTFCVLIIGSGYLIGLTSSNPTPEPSVEPTSETERDQSAEKKGDLDLETQDQVAILKQINRVNEDGSYTFGYEAADGSFKIETRDVAGNVKGMFGFVNDDGELKRVSYSASNGTGFQSTGSPNIPPLPGTTPDEDGPAGFQQLPNKLYQQITRPRQHLSETSSTDESTRINLLQATTPRQSTPKYLLQSTTPKYLIQSTTPKYLIQSTTPKYLIQSTTPKYFQSTTAKHLTTPRYSTSTAPPQVTSARVPIFIYGTTTTPRSSSLTTARPVVIQHIPKVRPTPATSSTEPTESEEITSPARPVYGAYLPKKSSTPNYISFTTTEAAEVLTRKPSVVQAIKPRVPALKKILVTKRPLEVTTARVLTTTDYLENDVAGNGDLQGNGVRRQLGFDPSGLATSGTEDSPDVYGAAPTPRPYPASAYRQLFTQIPQHQRILQSSYIQNQNQYLAAALEAGVNPQAAYSGGPNPQTPYGGGPNPQTPYGGGPSSLTGYGGGLNPQTAYGGTPNAQAAYGGALNPQGTPGPPQQLPPTAPVQPQANTPPGNYVPQDSRLVPGPGIPPSAVGVSPQYLGQGYGPPQQQQQQYNPQLYIPPALMEQIIRMILLAQQQRQPSLTPFQQALVSTLGANNVPPDLLPGGYDPRYQQPGYPQPGYPQPGYSQPGYSQPGYQQPQPYPPRAPYYDPRYQDSRYSQPYPPQYQNPYPYDQRYPYPQPLPPPPPPRAPYGPRPPPPYGYEQGYQQDETFLLRMLLNARYPAPVPQDPSPQIQNSPVERSPVYGQRLPDSTTAPTSRRNRFGAVRNVQILDSQNNDSDAAASGSSPTSTHKPS